MAKKTFFIFILVSVLVIGSKPKEANSFALAVAPAVLMNVASALVMGGGMYYCYTHGGKEAWAQLQSATKDGVEVTKDWIKNKIAEMNGISTEVIYNNQTTAFPKSTVLPGPAPVTGQYICYDDSGWYYLVGGIKSTNYFNNKFDETCENGDWIIYSNPYLIVRTGYKHGTQYFLEKVFNPPGFDYSQYPNLYGPQVLYANAYNALIDGIPPVLDWIMRDDAPVIDPEKDQVVEVPVVASNGSGEVMDKDGKFHPAPPGVTDPVDGLGAPTLDPGSVGSRTVSGESGTAPVNSALDDALGQAGIADGATVTGVNGQTVTWTDAQGIPHVSVLPPAVALELGKVADNVGVQDVALTGNPVEVDSGSDFDPGDDSFTVPIFDPSLVAPEKEDIPWDDWLSYVPFMNLVQGSSLTITNPDPVLDVAFADFMGMGSKTISVDFSSYQSFFDLMGAIIYSFSCIVALKMALTKRG